MKPREWHSLKLEQRQALEKYLSRYPVKVGQIAKDFNIKVKISSLHTGISGEIKREDGGYIIRVNRYETRERQRFTIAHEIAHFLLHKDLIDSSPDGIIDNVLYRSGAPENTEYEANRLAAEIVMPASRVEELLQEHFNGKVTDEAIEGLAESFQVSKAAMEIRLKNFL